MDASDIEVLEDAPDMRLKDSVSLLQCDLLVICII